jgi:colanic acid/amylovoran biosynthesis glycosyltransferase
LEYKQHDELARPGERLAMSLEPTRFAYLVSKYPAISHTFILREVLALGELGIAIEPASINAGPAADLLPAAEQAEAARTFYIKAQGASGAIVAVCELLVGRPLSVARTLRVALELGGSDLGRTLLCLFYLLEAAILVRWMERRSLTHVHVHFASQAATVALLATHLAPVTLSISVHGPDEFYDIPGSFLSTKMARARFVTPISYFAQSQLMRVSAHRDWHKFHVVRLGVATNHFTPRTSRASSEPFEVLCVGRLVAAKGQRILVEAMRQLVSGGRSVHLTLVGDGPDRPELEQMVREYGLRESVRLAGAINQDHIRTFYAAADIFALASFAEGIPVVLMEAMASEVPCVATAINGIPELIRDGVDGLLVPASDIKGMVDAIARLMDDAALRQALGAAGRLRVQQAYELKKNTARLAEIFRAHLSPALGGSE